MRNILIFSLFIFLFASCKKEKFFSGTTDLRLSEDTIAFDTVFTLEPGTNNPISVTQIISVFNKEKSTVKAKFELAGGKNSPFRINVNGFAGPSIPEVEIPGEDSIFLFIQCSLKPNNQLNPAIVMDSILSSVGNAAPQKTYLTAYGWDAIYVRRQQLPCGGVWDNKTKPYVIVDGALVAEGCTFTIKEGVTVYNSPRSTLFVEGTLKILGTAAERVKFKGNKARYDVEYYPSQWVGIRFLPFSKSSIIEYADIHNAAIGVQVDSVSLDGNYKLKLKNSTVMHCGTACVAGITGSLYAENCIFAEGGNYTFFGLLGGDYNFVHCTFSNHLSNGVYAARKTPQFAITNTYRDEYNIIRATELLQCKLINSIIWGNMEEEFSKDDKGSKPFTADIRGSFIRSKEKLYSDLSLKNTYNQDPKFKKISQYNFALDSLSPCIDAAIPTQFVITEDLIGNSRDSKPDVGAIEKK